jgi:hypothetical protein
MDLAETLEETPMIDIQVLQTGCAGCRKIEQLLQETLHEMGIQDEDIQFITRKSADEEPLPADARPYLVIDGEQLWRCSPPTKTELMEWLYKARTVTII